MTSSGTAASGVARREKRREAGPVRRILVVKPSSLGDVLHAFPAVALLHERFPEAVFDWLIHPACAAVLDYAPVPLGRRILFRRKELGSWRLPFELGALARDARRERYDLVVDFQGLLRSSFVGWLTRHGRYVGFARPREKSARLFYRETVPVDMTQHAVRRCWALAWAASGGVGAPPEVRMPELPHREASAAAMRQKLIAAGWRPERERLIALAPGARWPSKCFAPELFAAVAQELSRLNPDRRFVLLGAPSDAALGERIVGLTGALSLIGRTDLRELLEILRLCDTVICNDSGPMHLMAALNRPVAAFFGPTLAERTGPFGAGHLLIRDEGLDCLGCLKRECPRGDLRCHRLEAESVARRIHAMLAEIRPETKEARTEERVRESER